MLNGLTIRLDAGTAFAPESQSRRVVVRSIDLRVDVTDEPPPR